MAWSNCQHLEIKKELVLVFFECLCSHKNMERDFVLPFRQVAVPTLCQGPISEGRPSPALPFSCDFYYLLWVAKEVTCPFSEKSGKDLGDFHVSYSCSVWEAGPVSLSLSFISSHCLHRYSSWTFTGHSQAGSASPVTHTSVTCPEMKLSQGLWKGQTAPGGWVNPLHWTFSFVAGAMCT